MQIVGALDVHRRQITYKTLDLASGDLRRGRLSPATRESVREWLERFTGCEAEFALEGTTGWRFVAEEIERAGHVAHLADPAETAAKRGNKRRAKTDRADCDLQLKLLLAGSCPSRGFRRRISSSCVRGCGRARRSSTSAAPGSFG
jgi:transposase